MAIVWQCSITLQSHNRKREVEEVTLRIVSGLRVVVHLHHNYENRTLNT